MRKRKRPLMIIVLLLAMLLAACGGGADPTAEPVEPTPSPEAMEEELDDMEDETVAETMDEDEMDEEAMGEEAMDEEMDDETMSEEMAVMMDFTAIYATSNPGELENDAIVSIAPDFNEMLNSITAFADGVSSVESVALTTDGTYYLTVDLGEDTGGIVSLNSLSNMSPEALTLSADLSAPKGLYIAEDAGLVLVADFGAQAIAAYDLSLTPQFTITDFGDAEGSVWDVYHDAASDTLFATGTDGTLIVYENFSEMMGANGPSKTIVPSGADGSKISVNLHGVWYNAATDELILTDVGDAASAEDGALFVIPNASEAEGNTTVSVMVAGPNSMLGNPVDVVFDGVSAYVAEKSNDAILRFDNLLATDMMGMMGDAAPSATFDLLKAESLWLSQAEMAVETMDEGMADEAMDEDSMDEEMSEMMNYEAIYATSNPGDLENDAIISIAPDFSETLNSITGFADGVSSVESIALATDGTYFLTVDLGEGAGGLVSLSDLTNMSPEALSLSTDLTAPKGLYVAEDAGLVLVADFGAQAIAAYDLSLTPQFTITDFGDAAGSVWDVYHDADSDTLFATGTDGTLIVYENFSEMMGAAGPSKTIVPSDADGSKISVNLHGVWYNAATDELILTDVGDAASAEDGALFVIPNVFEAEGNTTVSVMIAGPDSWLGNPVDVVFDGTSAYVAEKSNDAILRFDDVLAADMMGMMGDAAPSATFELLKAESVWLSQADMMTMSGN